MTKHTWLSYLKSFCRIVGYSFLFFSSFKAVMLLIMAEVLGILEELPGAYTGTKT